MKPIQKLSVAICTLVIMAEIHSANAQAKSESSDSGFAQVTVVVTDNNYPVSDC